MRKERFIPRGDLDTAQSLEMLRQLPPGPGSDAPEHHLVLAPDNLKIVARLQFEGLADRPGDTICPFVLMVAVTLVGKSYWRWRST